MVIGRKICTATTKAGDPCRAVALPDSELCFAHSGRSGDPRKAQAAKIAKLRREKEPLLDHRLIAERDALPLIYQGLRATIDEPGFSGPDMSVRLLSMMLLVLYTGAGERPEIVYMKLRDEMPKEIEVPMPPVDEWLRENRREWDRVKVRHSELTGLVPEPYPSFMIPDSRSMNECVEEGRAYLRSVYGEVEDVPGLDSHVRSVSTGVLIPRVAPNELAA